MSHKVTISPANLEFNVEGETILSAALAAGINLPHSCKDGACSACKCKLTSGQVTHDQYNLSALSTEEAADNYILTCKARLNSDITLDLPGFSNGFPIKTLPAKIESLEKTGSVAVLKLRLPANQVFDFYAGQYVDVLFEGQARSYSIANSPTNKGSLELHIRHRPGGLFSEAVWNKLAVNQILRFKGPLGSFTLQEKSSAPILLVCGGTGFAPIKSLLEYLQASGNTRKIHLLWGNNRPEDFYLTELLVPWQAALNLKVQLCAQEDAPAGYFNGTIAQCVEQSYDDLSSFEVYACGNPAMIEHLYNLTTSNLQLAKTAFFSDAFSPSK